MTDPDRLEWALHTMMERAHALESNPLVEVEGTKSFIKRDDWDALAEMMVQGMNAPAAELVDFLGAYSQGLGLQNHMGALLEIFVLGSLVGRTD